MLNIFLFCWEYRLFKCVVIMYLNKKIHWILVIRGCYFLREWRLNQLGITKTLPSR